jgi:tRNA A37 methylthiotransferase MiaB
MQSILENIQIEYNKSYLNQYCEVLVENKLTNQEKYFGRTKYMIPVIFDANNCKPGELIKVKITSFNRNNLFGSYNSYKIKAA